MTTSARIATLLLAALAALAAAGRASASYGWSVKPFDRQHPVRAYLDDPRMGANDSFHFGIAISAPDGTAVYAVAPGRVDLPAVAPGDGPALEVVGAQFFAYWHLDAAVRQGQWVRLHQLLGHVHRGWRHVHFAEKVGGEYVNPLRPGALVPFRDTRPPVVRSIRLTAAGLVVDAYDRPALEIPDPRWANVPVTPSLIRRRVLRNGRTVLPWRTAVDFRLTQVHMQDFHAVYAPGTRQNHERRFGDFRFFLSRGFGPRSLGAGVYRVQVLVEDVSGNATTGSTQLRPG